MADTFNPKFGAILALQFENANCTTGEANTDMTLSSTGGCALFVPPGAGSVIGISCRASAAVTAGSIALRAHKDSTAFANSGYPNPTLDTTNASESYATVRPGVLTFAAAEGVGIEITTTTTLQATNTIDVDATLFVQLDPW